MAKDSGFVAVSTKKNDTQVFSHPCVNDSQDKLHGKNMRVFNFSAGKGNWKCTVCLGVRG